MANSSTIPSGDIIPIPPSDISNITEDSYEHTAYNYKPTNSKVNILDSDSPTSDPSTNPITPTKLSNSNIRQQIWSRIFNDKQEPRDLMRYDVKNNHWRKAKENWDTAISAAQCDFI